MEPTQLEVWLEIGREGRCFTYKDGLNLGVDLGDLVLVKLRGRPMNGLVVGKSSFDRKKIDDCLDLAEKEVLLSNIEGLIQKAAVETQWQEWLESMAIDCHTSSFRMLKAALPPGWIGQRHVKKFEPKKLWWIRLRNHEEMNQALSKRQKELEDFLLKCGGGTWLKSIKAYGFSSGLINNLIERGRLTREKREQILENNINSEELVTPLHELENPRQLTDEQNSAVNLFESLTDGSSLLLWGVTGSGKTEVYLHIASNEIEAGRHCLILTPEIGLIPQIVDRFTRRFGNRVLEYHSKCSEKERVATWRKILRSTKPLILIGTRSAVFLPLSPLGLIVLDEEHDSSYKQESPMPCYHARDMALKRAQRTGAKVILGSATPSLVTWKSLLPEGSISLARLNSRIADKPLPNVCIVDMRDELAHGNRNIISRPLKRRLMALSDSGSQAIILVPRRGYNSFLSCRSCGEVVHCPNCDVALTVHKGHHDQQWLCCHWCDHRAKIERQCHKCGSLAFKPFGTGTQRVIEQLSRDLEELRFLRFDRDTTGGRDGHRRILDRFAAGEADVLVGTQMLSKGIDLPRVTLSVVLAADGLLYRPDLSAEEETLQLFMQLAGRAGRGDRPGEVLVQTYCPDHPVIRHLVDGRYEEFLKKESEVRKESGLVPYSRACILRLSGESDSLTAEFAKHLADKLNPICESSGWNIIGPAPALITRVAGKSRWQILLHGPEFSPLPLPKGPLLWQDLPKGVSLAVDPDPLRL